MVSNKEGKIEFGDFQTPPDLARNVCSMVARSGFSPASVIEPTCGRGAFLVAALETFPQATRFLGVEQNAGYVQEAIRATSDIRHDAEVQILQGDFFNMDWATAITGLPEPVLIAGNPPWVTNATLGAMGGANLPQKKNDANLRGIDALTGKSNFDISEWMLQKNMQWLADTSGMLAVLCKTAVARKVLSCAWSHGAAIESSAIRRIDARLHFGASVDACLLMVKFQPGKSARECLDYASLDSVAPDAAFGLREDRLVADVQSYDRWREFLGHGLSGWRSGVKHDCSKIFELDQMAAGYQNGLGERVEVEPDVLFPLLKSSDLARHRSPRKWLLITQKEMNANPESLRHAAPKAWKYLSENSVLLDKRGSAIYRNRPRFSIFGIGDYSFSMWKVAISGLYKSLEFVKVAPFEDRPVVLDDTCYFFPCRSERECEMFHDLVQSGPAREFWSSFIFWDAKRPITAQTLNLLDLAALARYLNLKPEIVRMLAERQLMRYTGKEGFRQELLFGEYGIDLNDDERIVEKNMR